MEQITLIGWIVFGLLSARTLPAITRPRVDGVRNFAFSYLAPCLFFTSVYKADLHALPSAGVFFTYGICFFSLFALLRTWMVNSENQSVASANIKAVAALYPNAVGVGVPLVFSLYGSDAELILMGVVIINLLLVLPFINILMIHSGERGFYSYRKVATDPILLSILVGLVLNLTNVHFPDIVISGLGIIGYAALPVILFILGASLSFYSLSAQLEEKVAPLLLVKILLFPALSFLCARYVFHLSTLETQVIVVLTSLPTGVNVYLLSERYQVAKQATASVILISTGVSLLSVLGWEMFLQHWGTR